MRPGFLKIEFLQAARLEDTLAMMYTGMPERNGILRKSLTASFNGGEIDGIIVKGCLTAAIDDRIVGAITCGTYADQDYYHVIANLVVHPDHRNKGIASRLMDEAEDYIRLTLASNQRGIITLGDLIEKNRPESRFYARRGYLPYVDDEKTGIRFKSKPLSHNPF